MTERVKPEQDWKTVQGAVSLAGELMILAERTAIHMKAGGSALFGMLLESASVVTSAQPVRSRDEQ